MIFNMVKKENEAKIRLLQSSLDEINRQKKIHLDAIEDLNEQEQLIINEIDNLENQ